MNKYDYVINQLRENIKSEQKNIETSKSLLEAEIKDFSEFSGYKIKSYGKEIEEAQAKIRATESEIKLVELLRDTE